MPFRRTLRCRKESAMKAFAVAIIIIIASLVRPVAAMPPHATPTPVDCSMVSDNATSQCSCDAQNHGQYVSCVAQALNQLNAPKKCVHQVRSCAGQSTCGKSGFVTCQRQKFGTCDTTSGMCTKGTSVAATCAANTDCVVRTKCTIMSSADHCLARGGTPGSGSCCAPVELTPTPTPTPIP
jgi:hypothetical protein